MKKLLLITALSTFFAAGAQETPISVIEAESASLTPPVKVKRVNGYSGNAYVGDFDKGSVIRLNHVTVEKEGTYEFRVYYTSMFMRSVNVSVNNYPAVNLPMTRTTEDWNRPPVAMMLTYIWLDEGDNTILVTPPDAGGPNIDCFKIYESDEKIDRPEVKLMSYESDCTDVAAISAQYDNETLAYATDNDEYTIYKAPSVSSATVTAQCEYPVLVTGYLLSAGVNSTADVTKWTVESSADGTEWTRLNPSKTTDLSGAYIFEVKRESANAANDRARYYRLTATRETDVEVAEWQLFGSPWLDNEDGRNFPADITEGVDLTQNASAWPEGNAGDGWSEQFYNLFDRKLTSKYCMADTKAYTVEIALPKAYTLDYYTLTSVDVDADRNPKKWTLNGYNDEQGWIELDRRTDYSFPCGYATMRFNINSEAAFTNFLLDVEDNCGSAYSQLLKWQLFGEESTQGALDKVMNEACIISSGHGNVTIACGAAEPVAYSIVAVSGTVMGKGSVSASETTVDLPAGLYIVTVNGNSISHTAKVVVK